MVMASKTNAPLAPTEVLSKARRRSYTTAYKLDLLRRARRARMCDRSQGAERAILDAARPGTIVRS